MDNIERKGLISRFRNAAEKLLLFDYDGSLLSYEPVPRMSGTPKQLLEIVSLFVDDPLTDVFILTGRGHDNFNVLPEELRLGIIAEHGAMLRKNGIWKKQVTDSGLWKKSVIPILDRVTSACPGSFIEEKSFCLSWHYRNVEFETGYSYSRELIGLMEEILASYNLKILDGNRVVEIMNKYTGKAKAVEQLAEQKEYDLIISIGDDVSDEEVFEYLLNDNRAITIRAGFGFTRAKYKTECTADMIQLLNELSG